MRRLADTCLVFFLTSVVAAGAQSETTIGAAAGSETILWSLTPLLQWSVIQSPEADDHLGGFFDQYEFTPNKGSEVPFEIGIRDGALDVLGDNDTPRLQVRLASPTSNLGASGSQIDDPFFNQRLVALTRLEGVDLDLRYQRMRTEQIRLFPNTAGAGLRFNDLTSENNRFYRDRTGFLGEIRVRPRELGLAEGAWSEFLAPELSVRGGYQARDGKAQRRVHIPPSNTWFGLPQKTARELAEVGGGVLVAPGGWLTLALDFDYEGFRFDSDTITEADLGFAPPLGSRAIGFIPSSDRYTGTARFKGNLGERVALEGGFQVSQLTQADGRAPDQRSAGLNDVQVRYYSANTSLGARISTDLSFNGFVKYDRRENDTSQNTALFNPENQIVPFVKHWERFVAGAELELRMARGNRAALGVRYEDVQRDLDFARGALRIFPENALLHRDTEVITVYGRTSLRPWRGLSVNAELGYRKAPDTGYAVELDDNLYGELRASHGFGWKRPLVLSGYVRGSSGENRDFRMISAHSSTPAGPRVKRSYDRWNVGWGITASQSPLKALQLFASFFYGQEEQDSSLDLSNFQRYFQNQGLIFARDGRNRLRNAQMNLIVGSRYRFNPQTDAQLNYTFTSAKARYRDASTIPLEEIRDSSRIDFDIHAIELEIGHELRTGLRVSAGYRLRIFDDQSPVTESVASAVAPFDQSYRQHTVTVAFTLTSDLLSP